MADLGHQMTDEKLAALEKRIKAVYEEASKELQAEVDRYFDYFVERDKHQRGLLEAGKISEEQYTQWRLAQIGRGERMEALRDVMAERYTKANETAIAYVNDATPGIYSLNRNYTAYTIEQVHGNVGFTLYNEQAVKRLIEEQPDVMPYYPEKRAVNRGIDLAYGKKQITASITSSILQGKSIGKIADDLQENIKGMNRASAIRAARTATTNAQNAGRQATFEASAKMGIKVRKRWVATKDERTRTDHRSADGQIVDYDKPFIVGGEKMMFPGDGTASAGNVYNCRCTMRTVEKEGIEAEPRQMRVRDPKTGQNVLVNEMTYSEWEEWKKTGEPAAQNFKKVQVQKAVAEKQVEAPQISTREQAYKTLTDDIGFGSVSDNVSVIDEKLLTENVTQLKKLNDRFGALTAENNGYFTATSAKNAVAYSQGNFRNLNHQSMSLCGNSYGRGYDYLVSKERDFVSTNWSMPCLDNNLPIYTVTHEYGHIFENKVIRSRVDMDVFEQAYKAKMLDKNGAKKAMDFLKKEEAKQAKTIWQEITQIAKEENPDFLVSKNISEYGKTNYFEAFAETFANSQCGSPNELGKAMNIWLERNGY